MLKERGKNIDKAFDRIEKQLGNIPYFGGAELGMVDIAWLPLLHRADIVEKHSGYDFIGERPKLKAWQSQILATGLAEKSVAPDFKEAFSNFYLSDQTFLGRGGDVGNCSSSEACATDACC